MNILIYIGFLLLVMIAMAIIIPLNFIILSFISGILKRFFNPLTKLYGRYFRKTLDISESIDQFFTPKNEN